MPYVAKKYGFMLADSLHCSGNCSLFKTELTGLWISKRNILSHEKMATASPMALLLRALHIPASKHDPRILTNILMDFLKHILWKYLKVFHDQFLSHPSHVIIQSSEVLATV
jgi:hypothetical protein